MPRLQCNHGQVDVEAAFDRIMRFWINSLSVSACVMQPNYTITHRAELSTAEVSKKNRSLMTLIRGTRADKRFG